MGSWARLAFVLWIWWLRGSPLVLFLLQYLLTVAPLLHSGAHVKCACMLLAGRPSFIHLPLLAVGHGECLWFVQFFVRGHPLFGKYHPCNWRRYIITVNDTADSLVAC